MDREWHSGGINVSKTGGLFHFSGRAGMVRIGAVTANVRVAKARQGKEEEWFVLAKLSSCLLTVTAKV